MTGKGRTLVRGGTFTMGSNDFYPEEQPIVKSSVGDLWVEEHPVPNTAFRRFVADIGHVTVAELAPDPSDFPDADANLLVPGRRSSSLLLGRCRWTTGLRWWAWVPGADLWAPPTRGATSSCRRAG
jgi:formylglycine-generating enzyme required for sulfatase activity